MTLEQALAQLMTMNQLSYKVLSDRSIFVFPDTQQKHAQYDDQVIQTFYVSHADATELSQLISSIIRVPQLGVQPLIQFNKSANTLTVRASTAVMQIIEKVIAQNDKPRAEIVIDVEILEVNRSRAKQYGLNLSDYAIGGVLSPEVAPNIVATPPAGTGRAATAAAATTEWRVDPARPRRVATRVQPEHDLAGPEHVGFLSGRADRDRAGFSRPTPTRSWSRSRSCAGPKARSCC